MIAAVRFGLGTVRPASVSTDPVRFGTDVGFGSVRFGSSVTGGWVGSDRFRPWYRFGSVRFGRLMRFSSDRFGFRRSVRVGSVQLYAPGTFGGASSSGVVARVPA